MARQLVALVAALVVAVCVVALAGAAAQATSPSARPLPKNFKVVTPGGQVLSCPDTAGKKGCMSKCDKRCPDSCIVMCPSCKTFCMCDFYPGISCGDTRFTGGDENNFYFHGKTDRDFCIVSDTNLHINAHFIGKHEPTMSRDDFTWIQALGICFAEHRVFMGAKKTSKWSNMVDRLEMTFDGEPIDIPTVLGAQWESRAVTGVTVTRIAPTNSLRVQLNGVFDITATVVTMTEQDSRIHNYRVTEDEKLAHLDIGLKFYNLTDSVHGVLGQTYRSNYVHKLTASINMPVMGGGHNYVSSDIFGTDCAVARFGRHADISMLTSTTSTTSQHGPSQ